MVVVCDSVLTPLGLESGRLHALFLTSKKFKKKLCLPKLFRSFFVELCRPRSSLLLWEQSDLGPHCLPLCSLVSQ